MSQIIVEGVLRHNRQYLKGRRRWFSRHLTRVEVPHDTIFVVVRCMDPRLRGSEMEALGISRDQQMYLIANAGCMISPAQQAASVISDIERSVFAAIANSKTGTKIIVLLIGHEDCAMHKFNALSDAEIEQKLHERGVSLRTLGSGTAGTLKDHLGTIPDVRTNLTEVASRLRASLQEAQGDVSIYSFLIGEKDWRLTPVYS